jgi:hypothetical protein
MLLLWRGKCEQRGSGQDQVSLNSGPEPGRSAKLPDWEVRVRIGASGTYFSPTQRARVLLMLVAEKVCERLVRPERVGSCNPKWFECDRRCCGSNNR